MAHHVCPWWLGYVLASPLRRLVHDPRAILAPYVSPGMVVVEPGPGMGFFTLELARLVGPTGRVIAIDVQPRMIAALERRARRAGLGDRITARVTSGPQLGLDDVRGRVDFALAFAMLHEVPNSAGLLKELAVALKPGGKLLIAEPRGHVPDAEFAKTLQQAEAAGFTIASRPPIPRSLTAVGVKS